jgi:glycosyltransferase involved in cell wall biosynthesis
MPTISVVIASHGYGHLAAHCIESVLDQSHKADAILFVDDGVNDCAHLPTIYPELDYTLRPANLGTIDNFNDMLSKVTTDRVMFLGADNWLHPKCLEVCMAYDADIIVPQIAVVGEMKRPFLNYIGIGRKLAYPVWQFGPNGFDHHGSMMYDVSMAKEVGYAQQPHAVKTEEDKYLYAGMRKQGARVAYTNDPLIYYRRHRVNGNRP